MSLESKNDDDINNNSSFDYTFDKEWKEIKGEELQIKIIDWNTNAKTTTTGNIENEPKKIESGDSILLTMTGYQANHRDDPIDDDNGPIFQTVQDWLVTVGEPYCLVRAVDYALEQMYEGQTALVYSTSKFNFGPKGVRTYNNSPNDKNSTYTTLPANSNVIYKITISKFVMDTSRLNPYFTLQRAMTMKNIANDIYQYEWLSGGPARERAIHLYEKTARMMKTLLNGTYFAQVEENHPQKKECQTILIDSLNNVVAVYMRAKRWSKARDAAIQVLKEDGHNAKAAYRYAKSAMMDTELSLDEKDKALIKAETIIVYKDAEEVELKKLRAQWKKKKQQEQQQ